MTCKTLYISDLDGTLLSSNKEVSEYTKDTINTLIDKGVHISVATARSAATALKILDGVNFNVPVVLMNGVAIYDLLQKKYVKLEVIQPDTCNEIISVFRKHGLTGFMYSITDNEQITYFENLCTKPLREFYEERVIKYEKAFEKVGDFYEKTTDNNIIYFSFMDCFERLNVIQKELKNYTGVESVLYKDVYTENIWFLEIHSKNASKYNAVRYLREFFGYTKIIGFGDNLNDIPLLEACDEGYAVSNAVAELKERATGIIDDNNSDGVAKYIFNRESGIIGK